VSSTDKNAGLHEPQLITIGHIRSSIKTRAEAPKQGVEGGPDAWLEVDPEFAECLDGLTAGHEIIVITWFHQAKRDVRKVRPRSDPNNAITGVFATRSPDRPNPLGLHQVTIRDVDGSRLRIGPMEAIDGTPVVDIKPVLCAMQTA
jgi:tRNA-Thr(GGU) m(6)t(6)A37 methyltransferase TsaA